MAVNLPKIGVLKPVPGVQLGSATAEIRYQDRDDLVVIRCVPGTVAGSVFTQSAFAAPPVHVARAHSGDVRGLVINSGNANAATGERGREDAVRSCEVVAKRIDCESSQVMPFSTGVIGEFLPMANVERGIRQAVENLDDSGWERAANAILTTDTQAKALSREFSIEGSELVATGMVKGAGMIRPDMATMLAYVATNAKVTAPIAQQLTYMLAESSFNRITVDGDTSTNDAFVVLFTGQSSAREISCQSDPAFKDLLRELSAVAMTLAEWMVRDAEGATKFVQVNIQGGRTEAECLQVAYTIAHSPLVKSAIFAGDPNWGRFCMAIGRAGIEDLDPTLVSLQIGSASIATQGMVANDYKEEVAAAIMQEEEIPVVIDLGRGQASATVLTTDLSYEYVRINAEYRT